MRSLLADGGYRHEPFLANALVTCAQEQAASCVETRVLTHKRGAINNGWIRPYVERDGGLSRFPAKPQNGSSHMSLIMYTVTGRKMVKCETH